MKGDKVYGPYKGSDENGGRRIMVIRHPDGSTTSVNAARYEREKAIHRSLPKDTHVHHKDGHHMHDSPGNLGELSAHDNIADGNKRRKKKH